ncbi:aspartate aminotransferase family protein [candidate division KSB1 bacterium]|nr:aspartate aminotransferase family protein [candidate division KSB1 bacterium]RQW00642.1 MAG: aspartate aminotransferase family protein [candidate division KSB1 bacterium]
MQKDKVKEIFSATVSPGKVAFFESVGIDFVIGKRHGATIWDLDGEKKLINCHCNGGVFNLGHRNEELVSILKASLDRYDIGNHHLISEQRAILGKKLAELMPGDITYTVFGVSGGEAIDLAIKIARGYTGRKKVISAVGAYHGHTGYALAAGDTKFASPFGYTAEGFCQVPFNDVPALADCIDEGTAAVIFETIPATSGMPIPDVDFYAQVRQLCDQTGAIFIIDEVQTGFGRTGALWGVEHFAVVPDIIVIGKGMSGGLYPMTATCCKAKLYKVFQDDPFVHISTFGGAEVGCPLALHVLEKSSNPTFLSHVQHLASIFQEGFRKLVSQYPSILVGLRQMGLMMGIEMVHPQYGPLFTKMAYENGLLSIYAANDTHIAQLLPPLNIEADLAFEIISRIDSTLRAMDAYL